MESEKLRNIRIFFALFGLLAFFVMSPPSKDSLTNSEGTVISAHQLINGRFDVQYALDNGQVLKESFKGSLFFTKGPTNFDSLLKLQGTNEKINIWYKNNKAWQIQKQSGEFILKFEDIQKTRFIFLGVLFAALFLVGIFLPNLIKK